MVLCLLVPAFASTLSVDVSGSAGYTSIQDAIDAAVAGDQIVVAAGTYAENLDFLGKDVLVSSVDGSDETVLIGTGTNTVTFEGAETDAAELRGFTIQSGATRGVYIDGASPMLRDIVFEGLGSLSVDGGAVWIGGGSPTFIRCAFAGNVGNDGGAIYFSGGGPSEFSGGPSRITRPMGLAAGRT